MLQIRQYSKSSQSQHSHELALMLTMAVHTIPHAFCFLLQGCSWSMDRDLNTCCFLPQGEPLRLAPLGSQARSGTSSQPRPDGLAEERAAGLRIYTPLQPPPTQAHFVATMC